jgi:beta-lactamase regulating signal transducer with metallopeptidase domain
MYALRGLAVSFSVFVVLYATLSVAVGCLWRRVWLKVQGDSARRCADLLLALRLAPFALAGCVTLMLAVPSFLLLEPRAGDEPLGAAAILLGLCGIAVILAGTWNAVLALASAARTVARWASESPVASSSIGSGHTTSVLRISSLAPPLTAAGILRPSVWLSRAAQFVLSERELKIALQHELVHVRRRDNLRKLALRLVTFPGMAELECAWREATEMAADDAAVSSASEALDLAAAVIKLSRLAPLGPPAELTTALVHSPAESVNARVERLIAWTERPQVPAPAFVRAHAMYAFALAATLVVSYSQLLVHVHAATEWLVR